MASLSGTHARTGEADAKAPVSEIKGINEKACPVKLDYRVVSWSSWSYISWIA